MRVRAENVIRACDLDERIEVAGTFVDDLAADSQDPTTGNTGAVAVTPWWDSVTARGASSQLSRPDDVFGTHRPYFGSTSSTTTPIALTEVSGSRRQLANRLSWRQRLAVSTDETGWAP